MRNRLVTNLILSFALMGFSTVAQAQLAPEIGYALPSGAKAGSTVEVVLGGYDWTPDMQLFVHDPRIKIELLGSHSGVLVPEPPYWFGAKARGPAWPCPREFKARLTIPSDVPPGLVRWQVANANGASPAEWLHVSGLPEVAEDPKRKVPQVLPSLPVAISGQIRRIEEVDRYEFRVEKTGPVTIELLARQLSSPLHGMLQVQDSTGRKLVDVSDSEGRDLVVTFVAQAQERYVLSLHDLDYAGDRSYVYRLLLTPGPQVLAAYPTAGKRGQTQRVEFVGIGIATGSAQVETLAKDVAFPATAEATTFAYSLETPAGVARAYEFLLSDTVERLAVAGNDMPLAELPTAVTGSIKTRFGADQYTITLKKGDKWKVAAQARSIRSPLDLDLRVLSPDDKELIAADDMTGTTDPVVLLNAPVDGAYRIVVSDRSGKSGSRAACYRLSIEPQNEDVSFTVPALLSLPIGAAGKLALKVTREGGFKGAIPVTITGLPEGVTLPKDLVIPEAKNDLAIDLTVAADAPANAVLSTLTATLTLNAQPVTRRIGTTLLAVVMKPRIKITPEGLDDVRKVHRGSTFFAPLFVDRLEGFTGDVVLEMTSKQQRHRQGLASGEFTVAPDARRVEYPIFVPEWMETTKTSRMIVNGSLKVADPKGNMRTLLQRQELRIGILPEGAYMKLAHSAGEPIAQPGEEIRIPLTLSRSAEFKELLRLELVPDEELGQLMTADAITLQPDQTATELRVRLANDAKLIGEQTLRFRASAAKSDRGDVISETTVLITIRGAAK